MVRKITKERKRRRPKSGWLRAQLHSAPPSRGRRVSLYVFTDFMAKLFPTRSHLINNSSPSGDSVVFRTALMYGHLNSCLWLRSTRIAGLFSSVHAVFRCMLMVSRLCLPISLFLFHSHEWGGTLSLWATVLTETLPSAFYSPHLLRSNCLCPPKFMWRYQEAGPLAGSWDEVMGVKPS